MSGIKARFKSQLSIFPVVGSWACPFSGLLSQSSGTRPEGAGAQKEEAAAGSLRFYWGLQNINRIGLRQEGPEIEGAIKGMANRGSCFRNTHVLMPLSICTDP